jgi:hypothetical protein
MAVDDSARHRGPAILGVVLLVIAAAVALSVDVPRTGYGIKSDEATYIAAALSAAYDGDLQYERRDLERFAGLYHSGPEGIFLKRGKVMRIRIRGPFPFVQITKRDDPERNRLFFGKSLAYSVAVAPFVRFFGLNGFLLFHVVLLGLCGLAAYLFLAAQSPPGSAAVMTTALLGASVLPVYGVFLMPEIFNFTLVLLAYFLWLYKRVRPESRLAAPWTDYAAAILLGICTYSKPLPTAILVAPLVALFWIERRWLRGFIAGAVAVAVAALCFSLNAVNSGEFNYQGGDRKTFYGRFPFDAPDAAWEARGGTVTTDTSTSQEVLSSRELPLRFAHNVEYFLLGRHFGFVPYFFPGAVLFLAWLASPVRRSVWRGLVAAALVASAVTLLILLPWTWSGGGGPPGNRYYITAYPLVLFLAPPGLSAAAGVLAWIGGALFTAKMLVNPFWAAKYTYLVMEKGPARRLPIEMTMHNDLPLRLAQPPRGPIQYRFDPGVRLYFLDQNSWPPEPTGVAADGSTVYGIWVSGSGRTDIIVRTPWAVDRLEGEIISPITTTAYLTLDDDEATLKLEAGKLQTFRLQASGVRGFGDYNSLLTARSTDAFIPHLMAPASTDYRNLGFQLRFRPIVVTSAETASPK